MPEGWVEQPAARPFRKAEFVLPGNPPGQNDAELVLYYFGKGQGGGVDGNIDRWVGMFSTAEGAPVARDQADISRREINGLKITRVDIRGHYQDRMRPGATGKPSAEPQRMLAAIVESPGGPWFFKAVGPVPTITAHAERFEKLLSSLRE